MNRLRLWFFAAAIACLYSTSTAFGQVVTGTPPFGSFGGGPFDTINLSNLNVHFPIPIMNKAGVGLPFTYALTYDSSIWYPVGAYGNQVWTPVSRWGWNSISDGSTGYVEESVSTVQCNEYYNLTHYSFGPYVDALGTSHPVYVTTTPGQPKCSVPPVTGGSSLASDGSGYTLVVSNYTNVQVMSTGGLTINPYIQQGSVFTNPQGSVVDPNGNSISSSYNSSNTTTTFTDTLNVAKKPVLTVYAPGPGSTPTTLSYWNPQGSNNTPYTIQYAQQIVETNFGCSGVTDYGRTTQMNQYLVSAVVLPDGTSYTFTYEGTPNPNHSGAVTGRLASVTLPTGGEVKYTYAGSNSGITCADGTAETLERYTPDTGSNHWNYVHVEAGSPATAWTTSVTDPQGNVSGYNFEQVSGTQYAYETERQVNQGSSLLLVTVYTCYNGAAIPCTTTAISYPLSNLTVQTTFPGLSPSKTYTTYNSYSLPTEVDEYDWGGSTASRKTLTTYTSCGVTNTYVVNRPCTVTVYGTGSSPQAQASFGYDANGNLLTESHTNTGGSPSSISRSFTHNTNGMLKTGTDYNANLTNYSLGGYSCNGAFPETITLPINSLAYELTWNCIGGVLTSVKDPNGQTTDYDYTDPNNFWRLTEIVYPDQGQTTITYTDAANGFQIATARLVSSAQGNHTVTRYLDSQGRIEKTVDGQACSTVTTSYDALGRVYQVSNPYCSTSSGATAYGYDALNRVNSITYPDGSPASISYSGNCTTATDPAGKMRKTCSDGLGRLTSVTEDPNNLDYQTTYTYDALNDLYTVAQGSQTRTYNHDMLGRLTNSLIPEVNVAGTQCTTSYGYDANGNVVSRIAPKENQNAACTTTVTTTYGYDNVNRLTSKSYSDSTPRANFFYDQAPSSWPAWSGVSFSYPVGRLLLACTGSAAGTCASPTTAVAYNYDPMGRIKDFWQCNPAGCGSSVWDLDYTYDKAGDVTQWVHPEGFTVSTPVNAAQQITSVSSSITGANQPQSLASSVSYTAWGAISQLENGCAGSGCLNALENYIYNNRLQLYAVDVGTTSNDTAEYCKVYNYYSSWTVPTSCPAPGSTAQTGTTNNGNVNEYWYLDNSRSVSSRTETYTYDTLNRVATAVDVDLTYGWSQTYTYDRYGNMTCSGTGLCTSMGYNSNNQLTTVGSASLTYDAAGNLMQDLSASHTYQWDAEGRLISIDSGSTGSFTFNALGQRVYANEPSVFTGTYWRDPAGQFLGGEWSSTSWNAEVPFAGRLLADYTGGNPGPVYFDHPDALGASQQWTDWTGNSAGEVAFYPWGALWGDTTNGSMFRFFNSLEWYDPPVDGYQANFRYYIPRLGRWLSPDPMGGDITNPQSLNRYAYVANNPTSLIDPLGLWCVPGCAGGIGDFGVGQGPFGPNGTALDMGGDLLSGDTWGGAPGSDLGWILAGNLGGIWGNGGFGSGPLSGDFGPMGYPSPGIGIPCDFGTCSGLPPSAYVSNAQISPPEYGQLAPFTIYVGVDEWLDPLAHLGPGLLALYAGGVRASPVASPWAPVAWLGTSAATAIVGSYAASYAAPLWELAGGWPAMYNCLASASLGATHAVNGWAFPGGWSWPSGICGKIGWFAGYTFGD